MHLTDTINKPIERTTITEHNGDWWECRCGNTPRGEGFFECDREGQIIYATHGDWIPHWYVCDRCGRIIDQKTLRVVGYRFNNTLSTFERKGIDDEIAYFGYPD